MSEVIVKPAARTSGKPTGASNRAALVGTVTFKPQRQPAKPVTRRLTVKSEYEPAGDQPPALRDLWAAPPRPRRSSWRRTRRWRRSCMGR